jgi:hypothetical protein
MADEAISVEAYNEAHTACPQCGNTKLSQTYAGYIPVRGEDGVARFRPGHKDENTATCFACKWSGIVHDLVPEKEPVPDFGCIGRTAGSAIVLCSDANAEIAALKEVLTGIRYGRGNSALGELTDHLLSEIEEWEKEERHMALAKFDRERRASVEIPIPTKAPTADMTIIPKHAAYPFRPRHG